MARTSSRTTSKQRGRVIPQRRPMWRWPLLGIVLVILVGLGILLWQRPFAASTTDTVQPIATLSTQDVHALVWSPADADTVFFGHHGGLLRSTDGGRTWQPTTLTNADAMIVTASPADAQRVYAAGHGIFRRSDDAGMTWTAPDTAVQGADIHGFAQSPTDADHLYAFVVGQGLLTSDDGGATWMPTSDATTGEMHAALAVSADGTTLLRGTATGVQQSTDHGATWSASGTNLSSGAQIVGLAVADDTTLFAATTNGLYRRDDPNGAWQRTDLSGTILAVAVSPVQPNVVLAVDEQRRVFRSDDRGATWGAGN